MYVQRVLVPDAQKVCGALERKAAAVGCVRLLAHSERFRAGALAPLWPAVMQVCDPPSVPSSPSHPLSFRLRLSFSFPEGIHSNHISLIGAEAEEAAPIREIWAGPPKGSQEFYPTKYPSFLLLPLVSVIRFK